MFLQCNVLVELMLKVIHIKFMVRLVILSKGLVYVIDYQIISLSNMKTYTIKTYCVPQKELCSGVLIMSFAISSLKTQIYFHDSKLLSFIAIVLTVIDAYIFTCME